MRVKILSVILLAGFVSVNASAGFEQFNDPIGGMAVFDSTGSTYLWYSGWGLADLQAITTNNRTFELLPNINNYGDGTDPYWSDGEGDGNKVLEANTLFEMNPISSDITSVTFNFTVDAYDLDPRYTLTGFVKVLNPATGYTESIKDDVVISGTGSHSLQIFTSGLSGQLLQAGWRMRGLNANPADDWGSATVTATELFAISNDSTPPSPATMSFYSPPAAVSDSAITMTAVTAVDALYDVEYLFTNFVAGTSSGWQSDTNYTETGLSSGVTYFYSVIARDTSGNDNRNNFSPIGSATTLGVDNDPPLPSQMSFAGFDSSPVSVKLTATTATDASGVEYYFACTAGDGNDSGWQNSPVYYDTGLTPGSDYSYTVIARDVSSAQNSNIVSAATNVTTLSVSSGAFSNALTSFSGNTDNPATLFEIEKIGLTTGSLNEDSTIDFGASGAVFGDGFGVSGRNILKTIAAEYQGVSFEAYATLTFSGAADLSGFIGMGQGIQTGVPNNYGVPELNLSGVNGVVAQFKDSTAGSGTYKCNLFKFIGGDPSEVAGGTEILSDPVSSTETIRARLIYDAATETVNVAFDKSYTGGAFVADQDMGTVSTTNGAASMWDGAPVRVYVGGGEGTIVKDFKIVVTREAHPVFQMQTESIAAGGSMIFSWQGAADYTYELQYRTNLVSGSWLTDPSPGASGIFSDGGSVSATSTVDSASVFYRIIAQ